MLYRVYGGMQDFLPSTVVTTYFGGLSLLVIGIAYIRETASGVVSPVISGYKVP